MQSRNITVVEISVRLMVMAEGIPDPLHRKEGQFLDSALKSLLGVEQRSIISLHEVCYRKVFSQCRCVFVEPL